MVRTLVMVSGALFVVGLAACGSDKNTSEGQTMTVQGTVSQGIAIDNGRAVAVGSDGRVFWSYLDADRDFTLKLPVGQSYRVLIANQLANGGQKKVGYLLLKDGSQWIGANGAITVDLGRLKISTTTTNAGAVKAQCASCSSGADKDDDQGEDADDDRGKNHDDDSACHRGKSGGDHDDDDGDDENDCNVCKDGNPTPLTPSKPPGSECDDKDDHGGSTSGTDGGAPKNGDDNDDDKPCSKKGSSASGSGAGSSSGSGSSGSCKVSSECSGGSSCVACKCGGTSGGTSGGADSGGLR